MAGASRGTWLIVAALVLVGVLPAVIIIWLFTSMFSRPDPPDVSVVAQSAQVVAADRTTTARIDGRLASIGSAAPWLRPRTDQVIDKCAAEQDSGWKGDWYVACKRTVVRYYGFDGDFVSRTKSLGTALTGAGWDNLHTDEAIQYYQKLAGKKVGGATRPYSATDLPSATASHPGTLASAELLEVSWAQRPTPFPVSFDVDRGARPGEPNTVYREVRPLDVAAFARSSFKDNEFVLRLSLTFSYYYSDAGTDLA